MDKILGIIAAKLFQLIWPLLTELIANKFSEYMPQIIKAVVVAISQSAGQLVVDATDKVTDVIPGPVDDWVVDTIVERTREALNQFGVQF